VIGVVWITSTLTVFFRDLQQAIPIAILFLMLVSPIAYTHDMIPEHMRGLLSFNPLARLMHLYRSCLFEGYLPVTDFLIVAAVTVFLFYGGYRVIIRLKPILTDYV
jgi:lipopolysaccharide transport system permease protein